MTKYIDGYVCAFGNQHACFESSLSVSDWASWVQAVGSVCAILVSAGVVWWQVRKQHRLQIDHAGLMRLQHEVELLDGATSVLSDGQDQLALAADALRTQAGAKHFADRGLHFSHLDMIVEALLESETAELGDAALNLSFRAARRGIQDGLSAAREAVHYAHSGPGGQSQLNRCADEIDEARVSSADFTEILSDRLLKARSLLIAQG